VNFMLFINLYCIILELIKTEEKKTWPKFPPQIYIDVKKFCIAYERAENKEKISATQKTHDKSIAASRLNVFPIFFFVMCDKCTIL